VLTGRVLADEVRGRTMEERWWAEDVFFVRDLVAFSKEETDVSKRE
jgi:hypothetical protein